MLRFCQLVVSLSLVAICASKQNSTDAATCRGTEVGNILLEISNGFIHKAEHIIKCGSSSQVECPEQKRQEKIVDSKFMDCSEVKKSGNQKSGVYTIWPRNRIMANKPLKVYCDMHTDGGGWTVIQRRGKFSTYYTYFNQEWSNFKNGFGLLEEEFWIGNDYIYAISNQGNYEIRFDLKDASGQNAHAVYDTFWVEHEDTNYILHIDGYRGNAGDAMGVSDKAMFSTKDRNNGNNGQDCAKSYYGSWWWNKDCLKCNINGVYYPGSASYYSNYWHPWKQMTGMAATEIKLRPVSREV